MTQDQIINALQGLRPGAVWNLRGETYKDIEWLDNAQSLPSEAEVTAYVPVPSRSDVFKQDPSRIDLMTRLKTATPSQIDTFIDNNVTSLAQCRTVLKALLKVIATDYRN